MTLLALVLLFAAPDAGRRLEQLPPRPVEVAADRLEVLGKQRRAIYSGHATARRDDTRIRCERITVLYAEGNQVTRVEADGSVEVQDGDRWARGERAEFDNLTGVLVMTGSPEARQGGTHVRGSRVSFTVGSDTAEVLDATTVMASADGGTQPSTQIDARRLLVHRAERQAVWTGQVRVLRGPTDLRTERLVAHYSEANELTRLEATGGVEVTDKDRWAKGARADYDHRKGVLVVTGSPQARQGQNRLSGTKVTFVVGKDRLLVENARTQFEPKAPGPKKGSPR